MWNSPCIEYFVTSRGSGKNVKVAQISSKFAYFFPFGCKSVVASPIQICISLTYSLKYSNPNVLLGMLPCFLDLRTMP